jgi:hypothetical protein
MNESIKDLTDGLFNSFKGYVSRSIGPILERLATLEKRAPEKGEPGKDGRDGIDGKSADEAGIAKSVLDQVTKALESIPVPKDGRDGRDGVDGKDAVIDVPAVIAEVVKQIPLPKDGKDGLNGKDAEPVNVEAVIDEVTKRIPVPKDGRDGADGKDAEVDYARVVGEVVKMVPPAKDGKDGADGKNGEVDYARVVADVAKMFTPPKDGVDGRDGVDGKDADPAAIMQMVKDAVSLIPKVMDGRNGEDGRDGRDGEPGKDAFAIEVLSGIDSERKYQRGTWASHKGGLWSARAPTDGMTGWDNIVVGIADIEQEVKSEREFVLKCQLSNGVERVLTFKTAALLDRGVFKAGDEYEAGDVVTWDGCMWIAQKDTQDKPKESDAWRLSVKKGRDGRDGVRGEKGERGSEGRAGKDLTQMGPDGRKW